MNLSIWNRDMKVNIAMDLPREETNKFILARIRELPILGNDQNCILIPSDAVRWSAGHSYIDRLALEHLFTCGSYL